MKKNMFLLTFSLLLPTISFCMESNNNNACNHEISQKAYDFLAFLSFWKSKNYYFDEYEKFNEIMAKLHNKQEFDLIKTLLMLNPHEQHEEVRKMRAYFWKEFGLKKTVEIDAVNDLYTVLGFPEEQRPDEYYTLPQPLRIFYERFLGSVNKI